MNWRTGARIAFATLGLGVAATVFFLTRNQPSPTKPPVNAQKLDPDVSLVGGEGRLMIYKGDQPSMDVTSKAARTYEDGRWRFEDAVVKGLGDRAFTLRAAVLETRGPANKGEKPTQFDVSRRFTFEGSDGMVVEGESGTYDDTAGVMTIPGAVTFKRGRLSGSSNGATYTREQDTVTLLEMTKATVAPDAKGLGAADVSAKRMHLAQGQRAVRLDENARIAGEAQVITGAAATVVFSDDESAVKHMQVQGAAKVEAGPKAGSGQPTMSADNLTMSFHPDGVTMEHATLTGQAVMTTSDAGRTRSLRASWIDLFVGKDGRTLTSLDARDKVNVEIPATPTTARRTITSSTLQARGDEKRGLTGARFEGSPRFEEASAKGKRIGTAKVLLLALGGQLDAIQSATFEENVEFRDDRTHAWADSAFYDDAKQMLLLKPKTPKKLSRVQATDMTIDAREIDLHLETENLRARGEVVTRTSDKATTEKSAQTSQTSLFDENKTVLGTAAELDYTRESGKAIYTGTAQAPARLKQENTVIAANRIEFTESTNRLDAAGKVDSELEVSAPSGAAKTPALQRYRVRAETLAYDDAQRVAVYKGPKVTLTTEDGTTEATTMTFHLAKDSRALQRMRAEGPAGTVVGALAGGYEIQGDDLVYDAAEDTYTLRGSLAKIKSRNKDQKDPNLACQLATGKILKLNRKTDTIDDPGSGQPGASFKEIHCATPIRSAK